MHTSGVPAKGIPERINKGEIPNLTWVAPSHKLGTEGIKEEKEESTLVQPFSLSASCSAGKLAS
jgi:hypothetical protein